MGERGGKVGARVAVLPAVLPGGVCVVPGAGVGRTSSLPSSLRHRIRWEPPYIPTVLPTVLTTSIDSFLPRYSRKFPPPGCSILLNFSSQVVQENEGRCRLGERGGKVGARVVVLPDSFAVARGARLPKTERLLVGRRTTSASTAPRTSRRILEGDPW